MEDITNTTVTRPRDIAKQGRVAVILFTKPESSECQQMEDVINELTKNSQDYKHCSFFKVLAPSQPSVCSEYGVSAVPTVVLIVGTETPRKVEGANVPKFIETLTELDKRAPTACLGDGTSTLNERLKKLINSSKIMLFMKGNSSEPKCKFSRKAIEILGKYPVRFGDFDILSDNEVREGLKEYSNWPTYPQLYVNGELLGGVDIMVQLDESGELGDALGVTESLDEKLKRLINQCSVMIFMKGNPTQPRCGFSRTLIGIMNASGVPYKTFDILEDEEVRQGLKVYSNWPTYPQVYVKGELIGGVDIIQQLNESGELVKTLQG